MKLLTPTEAAASLRISRRTLFRLARIGELRFVRLGPRSNRVREEDVTKLVERRGR